MDPLFPPLYKRDQRGNIMVWEIYYDDIQKMLITYSGRKESDKGLTQRPVTLNNTKLAQTNPLEQAKSQARKRYNDKIKTGYSHDTDGICNTSQLAHFLPQLAKTHSFEQDKDFDEDQLSAGLVAQRKYDGERGMCRFIDNVIIIQSRNGNNIGDIDHIREQLMILFKYLDNNTVIDGELTVDGVGVHDLNSIIRGKDGIVHNMNQNIVYNIFDICLFDPKTTLDSRIEILNYAYERYIQDPEYIKGTICLVENRFVYSMAEIREYFDRMVAQGAEGIVLRKLAYGKHVSQSIYTHARNANLVKIKPFEDDEGIIVDIIEASGIDRGSAVLILKLKDGNTMKLRPAGSIEERRNMYVEKDKYIGQLYTYRYRGLTSKGKPNHATGVGLRLDI